MRRKVIQNKSSDSNRVQPANIANGMQLGKAQPMCFLSSLHYICTIRLLSDRVLKGRSQACTRSLLPWTLPQYRSLGQRKSQEI